MQVAIHFVQNRLLFSGMAVLYHVNGYLQRAYYHHHYNGICIEHHHHHHHYHHPNLCDLYHYLLTRDNMNKIKIIIIITMVAFIVCHILFSVDIGEPPSHLPIIDGGEGTPELIVIGQEWPEKRGQDINMAKSTL